MRSHGLALGSAPSRISDIIVLTKLRVNALVVATTASGYYMGARDGIDFATLAVTCIGTGLVASGAAAMNQVTERETDRLMDRTRHRPIADGRMRPAEGRAIAFALSAIGLLMLYLSSNLVATAVAAATLVIYAAIYTPMKRFTSLSTIVGAVPGALPPLIGWAAARGALADPAPWALFFLMFLWQLPHFLAIAWLYREDYARAGLQMLTVVDRNGTLTGRQVALWSATMVPFSLLPYLLGMTSVAYAVGAIGLGLVQTIIAFNFAFRRTDPNARMLFYASITYLPLLLIVMGLSKTGVR